MLATLSGLLSILRDFFLYSCLIKLDHFTHSPLWDSFLDSVRREPSSPTSLSRLLHLLSYFFYKILFKYHQLRVAPNHLCVLDKVPQLFKWALTEDRSCVIITEVFMYVICPKGGRGVFLSLSVSGTSKYLILLNKSWSHRYTNTWVYWKTKEAC